MTAQKNEELATHQEPVESHTYHGHINILDTLAENSKTSYENDLSLFAYWVLGYKPKGYRNMVQPDIEYPQIPLDSMNNVVHMTLQEVASLFAEGKITPSTVSTWLQDLGFYYKISTLRRKLSAINWMFNALEMDVPSAYPKVKQTFKALIKLQNRYKGGKVSHQEIMAAKFNPPPEERPGEVFKKKQSTPFRLEHLQAVLGFLTYGKHGLGKKRSARDKAMISLAWHGLFRRSELASIRIENIYFREKGMLVHLYDTKNHEQEERPINYAANPMLCPVRLVQEWLEVSGRLEGSGWLFCPISKSDNIRAESLAGRDVMRILVRASELAGCKEEFSGHSTRAGAATELYLKTRDGKRVQDAGGWRSEVWKDYVRSSDEDMFNGTGMSGMT